MFHCGRAAKQRDERTSCAVFMRALVLAQYCSASQLELTCKARSVLYEPINRRWFCTIGVAFTEMVSVAIRLSVCAHFES
jgi:hypothetical protein